ncbi:hypothetical protein [Corynebacterium sp. AOP34-BR1-29]|uniref:hypothetical protein n=1 Tax=Corynebacterium sp. AOP34-BR1-29 TaxID=3457688 RepID=UPI004034A062
MKREWMALVAILGMALTIDLLGWFDDSTDSTTFRIAFGVMLIVAYRIGRWSNRSEDRTQHQPPNPATERGSFS